MGSHFGKKKVLNYQASMQAKNLFSKGYDFHRTGQLVKAQAAYQKALQVQPDHADALYFLGLIENSNNEHARAVECFVKAAAINPQYAPIHFNQGCALKMLGKLEEALECYAKCIELSPDDAEAYFHTGLVLIDLRQEDTALQCFDKTIYLNPECAAAYYERGVVLQKNGNFQSAINSYLECVAKQPDHGDAYNNMGNVLSGLNRLEMALECFDRAIEINSANATAFYNRGRVLQAMRRYDAALESYADSIAISPEIKESYNNSGVVLQEMNRLDAALDCFNGAILLFPNFADLHNNRSAVFLELNQYLDAVRDASSAIALNPNFADAYHNAGLAFNSLENFGEAEIAFRRALAIQGDHAKAASMAYHCTNILCNWGVRRSDELRLADLVAQGYASIEVFDLLSVAIVDGCNVRQFQQKAARQYADNKYLELLWPPLVSAYGYSRRSRLRIGYLSADFHEHATMRLLRGVLAAHDRTQFAIYAYSYGKYSDDFTAQVKTDCDLFRDLSQLSSADAAALIAADEIDILVDLKGYTAHNRLDIAARRPAPLIVSWLGYPGTLGHERLADYLIGDPIVTPPEHATEYSETLALMPHCYQPNDRNREIGDMPSRLAEGLPENGFVFCSFNQSYKFDPDTFDVWCALLKAVPGSVLWLLLPPAPAVENLLREAQVRGIGPERIVFAPAKSQKEHLGRLQLADLALDTFPVTSHTTASDALWAGVPLITRIGDSFVSRVAASVLNAVGLSEMVTDSRDSYNMKAMALALDAAYLAKIRRQLQDVRLTSPLFDTQRFTRNLEALFMRMQAQHMQGKKEIIVFREDEAA